MTRIAHLSDLHFGRVEQSTLDKLFKGVAASEPDLVVVTGDLTHSGRRAEFASAAKFLKSLERPVMAIPGNHDVPVYNLHNGFLTPWRRFADHIGVFADATAETGRAVIIGVNSARRAQARFNWSHGKLRQRHISAAAEKARGLSSEKLVFVAAHHPFQLGAGKAGSRIIGRGEAGLEQFTRAGVSAVMTGHVHLTSVAPIASTGDRILSIQAGTSASTRLRSEAASFLQIDCPTLSELRITQFVEAEAAYLEASVFEFQRAEGIWKAAA